MLHPQVIALMEKVAASGAQPTHLLTPEQARLAYLERCRQTQPERPPVGRVQELSAEGPHGPIPLRLVRPLGANDAEALPVLVYFHGGGWVIGDLDTHDTLCREMANLSGCAVAAVHYRLAPEARYPAAIDDAIAATRWLHRQSAALGLDGSRMAVGGDSAGGNLAAVVALAAREAGDLPLKFQLLIYPITEMGQTHASYATYAEGYMLTRESMRYFRNHYLAGQQVDADWRASPLRHADLAGLPPALILMAGHDVLRDEGLEYAQRLVRAGNEATAVCFDQQIHGFILMGGVLDEARAAVRLCAAELRQALRQSPR